MSVYHKYYLMQTQYDKSNGFVHVIFGPMFAGKTTEMGRLGRRWFHKGYKCLLVRLVDDTRYSETKIVTHDKLGFDFGTTIRVDKLSLIPNSTINTTDVICVDEGQFYPDIEIVHSWSKMGKKVFVSALDKDFLGLPFMSTVGVILHAEYATKLNAVCELCDRDAQYTQKITSNVTSVDSSVGSRDNSRDDSSDDSSDDESAIANSQVRDLGLHYTARCSLHFNGANCRK